LSDELASALSREARRRGTSVSEVAREALSTRFGLDTEADDLPFANVGHRDDTHTAIDIESLIEQEWHAP
jgi:hypothetical protein